MLLHNQPALCSAWFPPFFGTLPITIMTLNTIVHQSFSKRDEAGKLSPTESPQGGEGWMFALWENSSRTQKWQYLNHFSELPQSMMCTESQEEEAQVLSHGRWEQEGNDGPESKNMSYWRSFLCGFCVFCWMQKVWQSLPSPCWDVSEQKQKELKTFKATLVGMKRQPLAAASLTFQKTQTGASQQSHCIKVNFFLCQVEGLVWNNASFRSPWQQMRPSPFLAAALGWAINPCTTCKLQAL